MTYPVFFPSVFGCVGRKSFAAIHTETAALWVKGNVEYVVTDSYNGRH